MTKQQLHNIRKQLDDLFYYTFDNLTGEQRKSFQNIIANIDYEIKKMEDF